MNEQSEIRKEAKRLFSIVNGGGDAGSESEFNRLKPWEQKGWLNLAKETLMPPAAIIAFRKAIDYEAEGLRMWYGECAKEGDLDSSTRHAYKFANNMLALLRRKVTPEHLEGLAKRNGPEAKMIYDEQPIERLERNRGIDRTFIIEGEIENFEITRIKPSDK